MLDSILKYATHQGSRASFAARHPGDTVRLLRARRRLRRARGSRFVLLGALVLAIPVAVALVRALQSGEDDR